MCDIRLFLMLSGIEQYLSTSNRNTMPPQCTCGLARLQVLFEAGHRSPRKCACENAPLQKGYFVANRVSSIRSSVPPNTPNAGPAEAWLQDERQEDEGHSISFKRQRLSFGAGDVFATRPRDDDFHRPQRCAEVEGCRSTEFESLPWLVPNTVH